jgi:hypothetical protein
MNENRLICYSYNNIDVFQVIYKITRAFIGGLEIFLRKDGPKEVSYFV